MLSGGLSTSQREGSVMSAPEHRHASDKWVAEAMRLSEDAAEAAWDAGTLGGYELLQERHTTKRESKHAELLAHLKRQADLMERMGEALASIAATQGPHAPTCGRARYCVDRAGIALAAFQESKQ